MGAVIVNMGPYGPRVVSTLSAAMPEETFVTGPVEGAEVVATLAAGVDPIEPLLTPSVRWVHVLGAGIDGIPLDVVGDRVLTCSRGASAVAIAEFVLAAMLCFEKRLPATWIGEAAEWTAPGLLGTLHGRTVGLVGIGAIGTSVAERARAFGMRVVAVRRRAAQAPPAGVELVNSLPALLSVSDHVVIAAPATPATYHLLDATAFAACKAGVHLVNVARGTLVDQDALLDALARGQVAMASLDVTDPEPLPAGHPFYSHPAVRLSPHISWSSPETVPRTVEMFVDNLRRYRSGEPLTGLVTAGY